MACDAVPHVGCKKYTKNQTGCSRRLPRWETCHVHCQTGKVRPMSPEQVWTLFLDFSLTVQGISHSKLVLVRLCLWNNPNCLKQTDWWKETKSWKSSEKLTGLPEPFQLRINIKQLLKELESGSDTCGSTRSVSKSTSQIKTFFFRFNILESAGYSWTGVQFFHSFLSWHLISDSK